MNLQWWMLDGGICLIILISMIIGAAKGIGDTLLRIAGMAAGMVLAVLYSARLAGLIAASSFGQTIRSNISQIVSGHEETRDAASESIMNSLGQGSDPYKESLPKTISGITTGIKDAAADAAADRLTELAVSVLSFVLIVIAVWLIAIILRAIIRHSRSRSIVLGFADRALGMALGLIKGIVIVCLIAAVIVPLITAFSPQSLPTFLNVIDETNIAGIIYDVNPLMFVIKMALS